MKLHGSLFLSNTLALLSALRPGIATALPEGQLQPRATKLTHRAETGITEVAGQWVAPQPGYLGNQPVNITPFEMKC